MIDAAFREAALDRAAGFLRPFEEWFLRASLVPTTPFLDTDTFPWIAALESRWQDIRSELDAVLDHDDALPNFQDISPDVGTITDDDRWKTFFFLGYGYRSEANCLRCPATAALLAEIPGVTTAFFSILYPHKRLDPHRGPYRGVLRYHLGLVVPEPAEACGISVDGDVRHWAEGRSLLFDDGYEHFAWNESESRRVVLFVDVERPLKPLAAWCNRAVIRLVAHSPFVRDAKRRHETWERGFTDRMPVPAADAHPTDSR